MHNADFYRLHIFGVCYVHLFWSFFFIEKQAQINRHEMILKKLFFFMYSGYFSCSNFLFYDSYPCISSDKNCRVLGPIVFFFFFVASRCHPEDVQCRSTVIIEILSLHFTFHELAKMCQTTIGDLNLFPRQLQNWYVFPNKHFLGGRVQNVEFRWRTVTVDDTPLSGHMRYCLPSANLLTASLFFKRGGTFVSPKHPCFIQGLF